MIFESSKNIPIDTGRNIPLALFGQCLTNNNGENKRRRRYNKTQVIETVAVNKYRKNGRGITFSDLLSSGVAFNKAQAQTTLKHCLARKVLFTVGSYKPQLYYPVSLKSIITKKNIPTGVTGARHSKDGLLQNKSITGRQKLDPVIINTLEGYVLPLLPKASLHIHNMHFKVKIPPECYHEIALPVSSSNRGKEHEEIIGRAHVRYCFYANGTVMVFTGSSNAPFKLENEVDLSRLIAFFGQMRDRLVVFLADKHERMVPDIMQWELTQWDVNRDVMVDNNSDWAQVTGLKIQVKHLDHLFRVYIKSMGKDTVWRVEESCNSSPKPAVEVIDDLFNNARNEPNNAIEYGREEVRKW
jgi:hypothetical protein